MNEPLMRARTDRAMSVINKFAPQSAMPLEAPISRSNVIEGIFRMLSRRTLTKASDSELATIYAALESAKQRNAQ